MKNIMKKKLYRLTTIMLALCMALVCVSCGKDKTSDTRSSRDIIEELAVYYGTYGNDADKKTERAVAPGNSIPKV